MNTMRPRTETRWFQNRLADVRISQRKLAAHLGIDPAAVSLMIRGKRKMSAAEAAEMARLMNVSVDEVLRHAGISSVEYFEGERQPARPATPKVAPAEDMLELPVPLSNGRVVRLILPQRLTKADADRIAALVTAFAVSEG